VPLEAKRTGTFPDFSLDLAVSSKYTNVRSLMVSPREHKLTERRRKLEDAALQLFLRRGFNAVGLRDLAAEAGVSLGNVYNHFSGKDALFAALVDRLYAGFAAETEPLAVFLTTCRLPEDLTPFGEVMRAMVERHRDYLTLVYVDIAEFGGAHVRPHYQALAARFRAALPAVHALPAWADPGVVFTILYMQYANHFVVERLIGAEGYLGLTGPAAIDAISRLFLLGLAPRPTPATLEPR
jgi:AcrR family transcriptional regulator